MVPALEPMASMVVCCTEQSQRHTVTPSQGHWPNFHHIGRRGGDCGRLPEYVVHTTVNATATCIAQCE